MALGTQCWDLGPIPRILGPNRGQAGLRLDRPPSARGPLGGLHPTRFQKEKSDRKDFFLSNKDCEKKTAALWRPRETATTTKTTSATRICPACTNIEAHSEARRRGLRRPTSGVYNDVIAAIEQKLGVQAAEGDIILGE